MKTIAFRRQPTNQQYWQAVKEHNDNFLTTNFMYLIIGLESPFFTRHLNPDNLGNGVIAINIRTNMWTEDGENWHEIEFEEY